MKRKTDLFQLIKAMSKSEKRYFTLDAQKSGRKDARYLELFQSINEQETYDEAPLKEKFDKALPTDKTYLYEAILRSMRDYRSANSYAARIKEMIMDAKYLYERGLYDQSEERLLAARELADELGDQLSAIELNKEQRRLLKDTKRKGYEKELKDLIIEKEKKLQKLNEELYYLDMHDHLLLEIRKNPQRLEEQQKEEIKCKFDALLRNSIEEPQTIQGKLRYFQCMALLYQLLGNSHQVHNYYSRIVECWDTSPKYKEEEFYRYILDASNLLHAAFSDPSKSATIPILLNKLEKELPHNWQDRKILFQKTTAYRLMYYINTGDFSEIQLIIKRIDKGLKQFDIGQNSEMVISFNVSILLFMAGEFSLCRDWTQRIFTLSKTNVREDIQTASRILFLIATLDAENFEETEASIRNITRYLQKLKEVPGSFNFKMLHYLKKIHLSTPAKANLVLRQLKEYVISLKETQANIPLGLDELIFYWVEGKITQQSISGIIKKEIAASKS